MMKVGEITIRYHLSITLNTYAHGVEIHLKMAQNATENVKMHREGETTKHTQ